MGQPFIGEIKLVGFNFAPLGWAECNGQLLLIEQNDALFTLLGTTYGGDGQTTFALPDFRGRVHVSSGNAFVVGEVGGQESVTISTGAMPTHSHRLAGAATPGSGPNPSNAVYATITNATKSDRLYGDPADTSALAQMIAPTGGAQPHENRQPFLCLKFIIALEGVFPQQN